MKKAKITVNPGSPGRVLPIFADVESAYCWATDPTLLDDLVGATQITLLPGEFIEVEWLGCEYVFDAKTQHHTRLDLVRLAKASETSNASGLIATIYSGWTLGFVITFKDFVDEFITIVPLAAENARLDLAAMFGDQLPDEKDKKAK